MSVITTWRAPTWRQIAAAMMPIGPAPVISTSSPTRSNESAVCAALPNGIEDRGDLVGDVVGDREGVLRGDHEVVGEGAGAVHAHALRVAAQVAAAGAAVAAMAADDVALAGDALADLEAAHLLADGLDHAHVLVADRHRHREWSSATSRPSCRCACRCRRSRSCARGSARRCGRPRASARRPSRCRARASSSASVLMR